MKTRLTPRLHFLLPVRLGLAPFALGVVGTVSAGFEGRIEAELVRGNETTALQYIVGENQMRIAVIPIDSPNPIDIVDLKSGELLLVFPHNQTYLRLKAANESAPPNSLTATPMSPMSTPPNGLPSGIGPQGPVGPQGMKRPPMASLLTETKSELTATVDRKDILGFPCVRYELKQRGETLEVWATDKLIPFQGYVRNQSPRFGPRMIDAEWPALLKERKLFPLKVSLHYDNNGPERLHFEVRTVKQEKINDADKKLFQPPADYTEIQPLPN